MVENQKRFSYSEEPRMRTCDPPICHFLTNLIYHLPIKGEGLQYTQAAKLSAQSGPRILEGDCIKKGEDTGRIKKKYDNISD